MLIAFSKIAWEEYTYWQLNDKEIFRKVNDLIKDIIRNNFNGLGKPEPLKGNFSGLWSRRISGEHRLVYKVSGIGADKTLTIYQARFHY